MASEISTLAPQFVLSPEELLLVDDLVTEDDTPVDNILSEREQRLLVESIYGGWRRPPDVQTFLAMANVGMFYSVSEPPFVPDMLLALNVPLVREPLPKRHSSYFFWLYGKPPDVNVEIVSNRVGGEDTTKLEAYAQLKIPYYVIHDPYRFLSDRPLRAFELHGEDYHPLEEPFWLAGVGLGLRIWHGVFEDFPAHYLRWVDAAGNLLLTGQERAEQEQRRAEQERRRAEQEQRRAEQERLRAERAVSLAEEQRQRADRLEEELRRLKGEGK